MVDDRDGYEAFYSEKLWSMLPAIYRVEDAGELDERGPLREIVERIGAQAAILRRSIDRLWEDQSIETCDDWLIDYVGDLLATNLVAALDARGRRVDVANTISYRRRKGTVGVLEEIAADITGWSVRAVEMFRRLARTRHRLDPAIGLHGDGDHEQLRLEQGLVGARTRTPAGGLADLRSVHGARLTGTAFDEYFHTADVRRGRGTTGRYNIPRLGVFVWRLRSFAVTGATPVHAKACPNQFTFDPTGRDLPLFARGDRPYGDAWISPLEHQVPGPISFAVLQADFSDLYRSADAAHSIAVHAAVGGGAYDLVPAGEVSQDPRRQTGRFAIDPVLGRIVAPAAVTADDAFVVDYCYGFSSDLGAGPYERRLAAWSTPERTPEPQARVTGGDDQLAAQLAAVEASATPRNATVWIDDSRTYAKATNVSGITALAVRAKNQCRPLVRTGVPWKLHGASDAATLEIDGLWVSGGARIVLEGTYGLVRIRCCTLDPGTWKPDPVRGTDWAVAADDLALRPVSLEIAGTIRILEIERSIVGPIFASGSGGIETLKVHDSILQAADPGERAIHLARGEIALSRCTVLGKMQVHRLDVSESILHDDVQVDDAQHGCVRFSAWASGSTLPRKYESVMIDPRADLFVSRDVGRPEYAQLFGDVDRTIREGAEDGAEMGAFAREKNAIKERAIAIKYQEYLPVGVEPVIVHVT